MTREPMADVRYRTQPSLQTQSGAATVAQRMSTGKALEDNRGLAIPTQRQPNQTGLPDNLKSGMEDLSGMRLDHVRVHYNSSKPAAVQAHAYAQGSEIHLGPGQEKHLPHELGHVVQQAQGRVKPTTNVNGVAVNDSEGLEREATSMGKSALQRMPSQHVRPNAQSAGKE